MAKKIRDTIHGYIFLTRIEEAVSQHPLVLRLHYIHQTSFTYLTYPNAHSTRYPHSLGVMHVAGEIFVSALTNTPKAVLGHVAGIVANYLDSIELKDEVTADLQEMQVDERGEQLYGTLQWGPKHRAASNARLPSVMEDANIYTPMVVLFQAVRLAAMLHDVAHPPFSHIVEYGLLQVGEGAYLGHERVGSELIDLITTDPALTQRPAFKATPAFSKAVLMLAREILDAKKGSNFWGIKETLLSGPIDADRLDYVRRDAYSAGMVPSYDIRRLVDAAFFRYRADSEIIEIGFRPNCLSSFENFFFARYDLYRYMIYHHDVVRRNLSVQRLLNIVMKAGSAIDTRVKSLGKKLLEYATGQADGRYMAYERFVDSYFVNFLWEIDGLIPRGEGHGLDTAADQAKLYLDLVLRRRNDLLRTLFKRPDDYSYFAKAILAEPGLPPKDGEEQDVPWLNRQLRSRLTEIKESMKLDENVAKLELAQRIEKHLNDAVISKKIKATLYCYYLGTFVAGPGGKVMFSEPGDATRILAESVSPTIAMLQKAWEFSPQLVIFFHMPQTGNAITDNARANILKPPVIAGMQKFLESP